MSYDISLYRRDFLEQAITERLGDWTAAPAIDDFVVRDIVSEAQRIGFRGVPQDPRFVAFAAAQGHTVADEFTLDTSDVLAQLMVFKGAVTFSIPYSNRASSSISSCLELARSLAAKHGLGLYDPQSGEVGG